MSEVNWPDPVEPTPFYGDTLVTHKLLRQKGSRKVLVEIYKQNMQAIVRGVEMAVRDRNLELNGEVDYTEHGPHIDGCDEIEAHDHWVYSWEMVPFGTLTELRARQNAS